jgi:hypothetical protein
MAASAQERAPVQANTVVRVSNGKTWLTVPFSGQLDGGPATFTGSVSNLPGGDTAFIALKFDYRTRADFALDEIIARIVITVEDFNGNIFSTATINPNTIHLNPDRVPLYYSATLYKPEPTRRYPGYTTRIKVFGNYE